MSHTHQPGLGRFCPRVEMLESRLTPSVTIRFDYSLDTSGFFNDPARRAALERAGDKISSHLYDNLSPITASGANSWTASFFNPSTNAMVNIPNLNVGANEIVVFVGAAPIGGIELGLATSGGYSASGSQDWLNTVQARGQVGALGSPKTDYATWGGMVTFNSASVWNFDTDMPTMAEYDFESVAQHELMHIFGFGLGEPAFTRLVSGNQFIGPRVQALMGGPVAVTGSPADHWAAGTTDEGAVSPMVPAIMRGEKRSLTPLDYAALDDIGWELDAASTNSVPAPAVVPAYTAATSPTGPIDFVVGTGTGVTPRAYAYSAQGQPTQTITPVDSSASGGLRVARGDVNGDGVEDTVYGTGPGSRSFVRVINGQTGAELFSLTPFEAGFTGGVNLAVGDLNGDGRDDLIISPDEGGGPRIKIYDGGTAALLADLYGLDDLNFRGGVRTAVGDINGDGRADLVVAAGWSGGPRIAVYDGRSVLSGSLVRITGDFFAFEANLRNGTNVTVADLDGDGYAEVIVGAAAGGAPRLVAFSGRYLAAYQYHEIVNVFVSDADARGGVRVASADVNHDGMMDVITGSGPGGRGKVQVFAANTLVQGKVSPWLSLQDNDWIESGVFVG